MRSGNFHPNNVLPHVFLQEYYPDAGKFDGFRFERMRDQEREGGEHQLDAINVNYLLFGQGRHAW